MPRSFLAIIFLTASLFILSLEAKKETPPAEFARKQIESLPKNDIWWTKNGETMLWSFKNLHTIFPTATVHRSGAVRELEIAIDESIGSTQVPTKLGNMELNSFLESDESTAISVLILHKGRVVFERYPRMKAHEKPVHWSVTKVLVSALVAILESKNKVNVELSIDYYIPELSGSDFMGIKIKNILDMATGINCPEEYINKFGLKNSRFSKYCRGVNSICF